MSNPFVDPVATVGGIEAHVMVVTQAGVHCLICTHDARGRVRTISGNARLPVLQLICYTFWQSKSAQTTSGRHPIAFIYHDATYECGFEY